MFPTFGQRVLGELVAWWLTSGVSEPVVPTLYSENRLRAEPRFAQVNTCKLEGGLERSAHGPWDIQQGVVT